MQRTIKIKFELCWKIVSLAFLPHLLIFIFCTAWKKMIKKNKTFDKKVVLVRNNSYCKFCNFGHFQKSVCFSLLQTTSLWNLEVEFPSRLSACIAETTVLLFWSTFSYFQMSKISSIHLKTKRSKKPAHLVAHTCILLMFFPFIIDTFGHIYIFPEAKIKKTQIQHPPLYCQTFTGHVRPRIKKKRKTKNEKTKLLNFLYH